MLRALWPENAPPDQKLPKMPEMESHNGKGGVFYAYGGLVVFETDSNFWNTLNPCESTLQWWSSSCSNRFESLETHRIHVKVPYSGGLLVVSERKQTNSPLSTDQGFSTASFNSRHALSFRVCTHPPPRPTTSASASSKWIAPTDNMWPKSENIKMCHRWLKG